MSPGVGERKWFGRGGFALGCGCKDPKAVAVAVAAARAVAASSPSTATTATSRRGNTYPSASAFTGSLTVPSASSSFLWEDAEGEADGDEVDCKRESAATTPSFSGMLREIHELEQNFKSSGRKSPLKNDFSPPPPPPPLPSKPVLHRATRTSYKPNCKEGHGDFSPPRPPYLQVPIQQHGRLKRVHKVDEQQERNTHFRPLPPRSLPMPLQPPPPPQQQLRNVNPVDRVSSLEDSNHMSPSHAPKHRKAKSSDNGFGDDGGSGRRFDGSVAVVKQSEDPLSDFRRSMLNMIVENRIVTGDELRELLRCFIALNAPRHHDVILRAFAEIWDKVAVATADVHQVHKQRASRPTAPRQKTPPRRRHPLPAWRA